MTPPDPAPYPPLTGDFAEFDYFGLGPLKHLAVRAGDDLVIFRPKTTGDFWHAAGTGYRSDAHYAIRRGTELHRLNFGDAETPRTDALLLKLNEGRTYDYDGPRGEFMRTLEREAAAQAAEIATLRKALEKINVIRNSIVGLQTINWSEHIYPLVAALNEAGYECPGYEKCREDFGTMLERTNKAESALTAARAEGERLRKALEAESHWHDSERDAMSKNPPRSDYQWRMLQHRERMDAIAEALATPAQPKDVETWFCCHCSKGHPEEREPYYAPDNVAYCDEQCWDDRCAERDEPESPPKEEGEPG